MQRLKGTLKKIAAISSGVVMLGATALGAVAAADLSAYPAPFVADGKWMGLIVVGTGGTNPAGLASDIAGAVDIAARLAQEATTSAGGGTTVTGGKSAEIILGTAIATAGGGANNLKTALKANDVAGLLDSSISWDDGSGSDTYDIKEEVDLGTSTLKVEVSSGTGDNDYESNPVVEIGKSDIAYYYMFMDAINLSKIGTDNPLSITFLGKDLKVTASSDADTLVAQIGTEYYMTVGDSVEVDGKTVTLKDVSSGSTATVVVDVDGTSEVVSTTAKTVNGIKIVAQEAFYSDTKTDRSATILAGTETSKSYNDGDPYIGQNKDDPDWVWDIAGIHGADAATTAGTTNSIGIKWDQTYNDANDPILKVGDCINAPSNYFSLCFDSLTLNDWADYKVYIDNGIDLSDAGGYYSTQTSEYAVVAETSDKEGFTTTGGHSTNTVYLWIDGTGTTAQLAVFYKDTDDSRILWDSNISAAATSARIADITYKDTTKNFNLTKSAAQNYTLGASLNLTVMDYNKWIYGQVRAVGDVFNSVGQTASTSEASELWYDTSYALGTADSDLMTPFGIIIKNPDSNGANDEIKLQIPSDQVYANVVVKGTGTTTTSSGGAVTINSIAGVPLVKLDTEVTDKTSKPLILVGGPAVNKLTAEALGVPFPTYGSSGNSGIPQNKALIKLVENAFGGTNVALVVAGFEASNTREAANVLKDFNTYDLSGKAVEVSGTTVTAVASTTTTA